MEAVLTDRACSPMCWYAQEDVCHCSCGGVNHGCLKSEGGVQPQREAKLDGCRYKLGAVGMFKELKAEHPTAQFWDAKGASKRIKLATKDQIAKYSELPAYRDKPGTLDYLTGSLDKDTRPYLLWEKA